MKKKLFILIISVLSIFFLTENTFSAWSYCSSGDTFCLEQKTDWTFKVWKLDNLVTNGVLYLLWFLWILSVIYWLYWAWHIFTAWSDDEKVQKWKKIIIRACVWLVVIFSAYPITKMVIGNDWQTNSWLLQAEGN